MSNSYLHRVVEEHLPEFKRMCELSKTTPNADGVILTQAAFSEFEYPLLGAAIKYAGDHGLQVTIIPHKE
jgi:hypothetical protein